MRRARYYECAICGMIHPWHFGGLCSDWDTRFERGELDEKHGEACGASEVYDVRVLVDQIVG